MNSVHVFFRKLYYKFIFHLPFYHRRWSDYTPAQKELFDSIKTGDIVEAWMPLEERTMHSIPESHRQRPWYVAGKEKDFLIVYKGSSSASHYSSFTCLMIPMQKYQLWKDGYVILNQIYKLPINCLIKQLDHLRKEEMIEANRIICIQNSRRKRLPYFPEKIVIRKYDIIRMNSKNYFVMEMGSSIHAVEIEHQKANHNACIREGKQIWWFDADKIVYLNRSTPAAILRILHQPHIFLPEEKNENHPNLRKIPDSRFPIGQKFIQPWDETVFVYLYTWDGKDYGVCLQDMENSKYEVRVMTVEYLQKSDLADDETMTWVINNLIDYKPKEYSWMEQWLQNDVSE